MYELLPPYRFANELKSFSGSTTWGQLFLVSELLENIVSRPVIRRSKERNMPAWLTLPIAGKCFVVRWFYMDEAMILNDVASYFLPCRSFLCIVPFDHANRLRLGRFNFTIRRALVPLFRSIGKYILDRCDVPCSILSLFHCCALCCIHQYEISSKPRGQEKETRSCFHLHCMYDFGLAFLRWVPIYLLIDLKKPSRLSSRNDFFVVLFLLWCSGCVRNKSHVLLPRF